MPFTFAHPAIVLPLNKIKKPIFSLTALVIGSMIPDFEYFLRLNITSIYSHTWRGIFWFDLPLGLLVYLLYDRFLKNILIDNLPSYLNLRFSSFRNAGNRIKASIPVVIISILIGAISHFLWDGFTHWRGVFVLLFPVLHKLVTIGGFPVRVNTILQHISTAVGLIVIAVAINNIEPGESSRYYRRKLFWPLVFVTTIVLLGIKFWAGMRLANYEDAIITAVSGFLLGLVIAAVYARFNGARQLA